MRNIEMEVEHLYTMGVASKTVDHVVYGVPSCGKSIVIQNGSGVQLFRRFQPKTCRRRVEVGLNEGAIQLVFDCGSWLYKG